MDKIAIYDVNCLTIGVFFMSFFAESMHAITVIPRCDNALVWRIDFRLLLNEQRQYELLFHLMPCFTSDKIIKSDTSLQKNEIKLEFTMHKFTKALAAIGLAAVMSQSAMAESLKLGFLVKQPEEPWFQTEWKFADKAGKDLGFEVIKIAVPDGEKTLNAIDSLAASGAKGFVICTPDPKLGAAIVAKARGYDMKVITVDDQFVNAKGKPMDSVPLVMMAASEIGARQGQELYKEMQKRGWDVKDTGVMAITADELDTARRRTTGSMDALKAAGFPEKQIYRVPTKSNDIPGAFDAGNSMLVQHPQVKHWLIVGMNDNTVLGGVRATEGQGFKAADVIGIGINGVDAVNELSKAQATGFYGSLLPSPDIHGYKTSEMLYNWVTKGAEPPKFTAVTDVVLITRDNFKEELAKKGL